jgi:hypothetical protein
LHKTAAAVMATHGTSAREVCSHAAMYASSAEKKHIHDLCDEK